MCVVLHVSVYVCDGTDGVGGERQRERERERERRERAYSIWWVGVMSLTFDVFVVPCSYSLWYAVVIM